MSSTSSLTNKKIVVKKHLSVTGVIDLINDAGFIFELKNQLQKGFKLDLSKIEETSMLGILVIYKIIEYSVTHNCFYEPRIDYDGPFYNSLEKFGFEDLINAYVDNMEKPDKIEKEYKNLQISEGEDFIIAPQALLRNSDFSEKFLRKEFLPKIRNYYNERPEIIPMIFLCLSEIILNFWEHAVQDTKSILVASGNKSRIEIACADTGNGIISTLRPFVKYANEPDILQKALTKGITSKSDTYHMGYGLWIIDEIIRKTKGNFMLISEGFTYTRFAEKTKLYKSGYWKGAIVYLSLPFSKVVALDEIEDLKKLDHIQINWS